MSASVVRNGLASKRRNGVVANCGMKPGKSGASMSSGNIVAVGERSGIGSATMDLTGADALRRSRA